MYASISKGMEPTSTSNPYNPDFWAESTTTPNVKPKVDIFLVNATAYLRACSLPGSQQFRLDLADTGIPICSTSTFEESLDPVDLSNIPEEYHKFADVFNKAKAQ